MQHTLASSNCSLVEVDVNGDYGICMYLFGFGFGLFISIFWNYFMETFCWHWRLQILPVLPLQQKLVFQFVNLLRTFDLNGPNHNVCICNMEYVWICICFQSSWPAKIIHFTDFVLLPNVFIREEEILTIGCTILHIS